MAHEAGVQLPGVDAVDAGHNEDAVPCLSRPWIFGPALGAVERPVPRRYVERVAAGTAGESGGAAGEKFRVYVRSRKDDLTEVTGNGRVEGDEGFSQETIAHA